MVDVALGEGGAEPAEERAAAGVAGERGAAFAVALAEAEELGVEGVGELVPRVAEPVMAMAAWVNGDR